MLTTDHVLIETWYLARARLDIDVAEGLVLGIRAGVARIENTELSDLEVAAATGAQFPDQDYSMVDRTSWSVMLRPGIHEAIAFDRDYSSFRLAHGAIGLSSCIPDRAAPGPARTTLARVLVVAVKSTCACFGEAAASMARTRRTTAHSERCV
ncbi:MAG TPA: hypothetical protein VE569_03705 [Acidimicrobiia bacterium]|nr:hypothetical protein [Acidimicrobiia bacterium]